MRIRVYNSINEIPEISFTRKLIPLLQVLEKTNPCLQRYHFLEKGKDFAFFCEYRLNLNIFTYSKFKLNYPVRIIGIPASVSTQGYFASSESMKSKMFEYISTFKGAVLILNTEDKENYTSFAKGETLPTHVVNVHWKTVDEYINSMRSNYRYRLKKALKRNIRVRKMDNRDFDDELYSLYHNVYSKSMYKLEKLNREFFQKFGEIIVFEDPSPIAFIQLYKQGDVMVFMFCGIEYNYKYVSDLYYTMLFEVIKRGIEENCTIIDLGQTTTDTKTKLGADIHRRYMYVTHSNKLIRNLVLKHIDKLSYNENHTEFNVMKPR